MTGIYAADGSQNVTVVGGTSPTPPTGTSSTQVQGTAAGNAAAVGNPVQTGGIHETTSSTYDNNDAVPLHTDPNGNLRARLVGGDFTGIDGVSNTLAAPASTTGVATRLLAGAGFLFNGTAWDRDKKPNTIARLLSAAASVNNTLVKASAGDVYNIYGHNANAAARYLKLYNKATAPVAGTDTPVATFYLAPQASFRFEFPKGLYFSTGIGYALTTGVADADTGALTAGDILALDVVYT
jgi:hypothetical protein